MRRKKEQGDKKRDIEQDKEKKEAKEFQGKGKREKKMRERLMIKL